MPDTCLSLRCKITTIFFDLFGVLLGVDQSVVIQYLSNLIGLPSQVRHEMGEISRKLITEWSGRSLADPLDEFLDSIYDGRS